MFVDVAGVWKEMEELGEEREDEGKEGDGEGGEMRWEINWNEI